LKESTETELRVVSYKHTN